MADAIYPGGPAAPYPGGSGGGPDIDNCAREQIQFPGAVQNFGCLLVVSRDWIVQNASANCAAILGIEATALVATRLMDHLPPDAIHLLRGKVQILGSGDEGLPVFGADLFGDGRLFDIALHRSGSVYLFDFEPARAQIRGYDPSVIGSLMARVKRAGNVAAMCDVAATGVWAMTGFDRVMIYRFEPDYSGVVIAEALGSGAGSYLGQRFPASDIPPQARALYTRNLQRIIADVDAPVQPLLPVEDTAGRAVDLSLAVTRAVSPIHLQYLRNMGVAASMSVSILLEGRLWGMIACHHPRPHYVDYETRYAIEMFGRMLAYELAQHEARTERTQTDRAHELHEHLSMLAPDDGDDPPDLARIAAEIGSVVAIDGIALVSGGVYRNTGLAPTEVEFHALVRNLARSGERRVFVTDHLEGAAPGIVAPERGIGGLLALPIRRNPTEFVLLLRREVTRGLIWAGPPDKTVLADGRLSPRQSFEAWREEIRGRCQPWTPGDVRAAEVLRGTLLELVLLEAALSSSREQRRTQQQEVMIAELNHRLRNVFGLIGSLVHQGAARAAPVDADPGEAGPDTAREDGVVRFGAELAGRIAALARANDMLTEREPTATLSLRRLICDEARAFAGSDERIVFTGVDAVVRPAARSTMALVIHELVTNAVKYGALSVPQGRVSVSMSADRRGALRLVWSEQGGPTVRAPARSGFGSALLGQVIPHELGGEAAIDFSPSGLMAAFVIPARQLARLIPEGQVPDAGGAHPVLSPAQPSATPRGPGDGGRDAEAVPGRRFTGRALVVEDNLLIAMNAADALRALGAADVVIVGSVAAALERVGASQFDLGVLDLDLGGVLSTPVAEALRRAGVPFLLATGYDDGAAGEPMAFDGAPRLKKPYNSDAMADAVARLLNVRAG